MTEHTRRRFLETGGALLGGVMVGTTITAAASHDRYIVKAKRVRGTSSVEVIHHLDPVDLFVVRGSKSDVYHR
jgi:hypothetical protein